MVYAEIYMKICNYSEKKGIRGVFASLVKLRKLTREDIDDGYYYLCSHLSDRLFLHRKKKWGTGERKAISYLSRCLDYHFDYRDFIYYKGNDSLRHHGTVD